MKYIILFFLPLFAIGQTHIKNQKYLHVQIGSFDSGLPSLKNHSISFSKGKYNKRFHQIGFGFTYSAKSLPGINDENIIIDNIDIPVSQSYAYLFMNPVIYSNVYKTFFINGNLHFNLGYESINSAKPTINDYSIRRGSSFILGGTTGLEIEYNNLSLAIKSSFNFLNQFQKVNLLPQIGYKIHLQ